MKQIQKNNVNFHELEFNEQLMNEREIEIMDISRKSSIINDIMKDLAVMVNEQGGNIQNIHENTSQSKEKTKKGLDELEIANKRQSDDSYCNFCVIN